MKKIVKFFLYSFLFIYMILAFLPKAEAYYLAEQELSTYEVTINNENVNDGLMSLEVSNGEILYQNITAGTLEQFSLFSALFYSEVRIDGFNVGEDLKTFLPPKIEFLSASHSVIDPMHINIIGKGDFGSLDGSVDLVERSVKIDFKFTATMNRKYRAFLKQLKKTKEGYMYEKRF